MVGRLYLGIESAPRVAEVLAGAEDEAREDLLLLDTLEPQLQVLSWSCVVRLHVVREQSHNFHSLLHTEAYYSQGGGGHSSLNFTTKTNYTDETKLAAANTTLARCNKETDYIVAR